MAPIPPQSSSLPGTDVTFQAASAGGDTVQPSSTTALRVKNASAAAITVTVASARSCDQGFTHNLAVSVPAGGEREIGPLPTSRFAGSGGVAAVTYSAVTSVTVAAVSR